MSRVLGYDPYKRMSRIGVANVRTVTAQRSREPSKDQNLKPFTVDGEVSRCVKNFRVGLGQGMPIILNRNIFLFLKELSFVAFVLIWLG